ncbi:alpha/beta hydrolase [Bacillus thuringiensis]|uniref:alpha/beta hydrolase n=1 Tax=Bacillus thuringiensis TaxID=1428 RepID=UPI00333D32E7
MEVIQTYISNEKYRLMGVLRLQDDKDYSEFCIFLPGYGCSKDEMSYLFSTIAKKLKSVNSIMFDYSGSGDSEGDFKEVNLKSMTKDALRVITYIKSKYNPRKIHIVAKGAGTLVALSLKRKMDFENIVFIGDPLPLIKPNFPKDIELQWRDLGNIELRELMNRVESKKLEDVKKWIANMGWVPFAERMSYSILEQTKKFDKEVLNNSDLQDTLLFSQDLEIDYSQFGHFIGITMKDKRGKNYTATEVDHIVINTIDWIQR